MRHIYSIGEYIIDFLDLGNQNFIAQPGGAPANVAACVAKLGGKSSLITTLGEDIFKDHLLQVMIDSGVDVTHVSLIDKKNMLAFVSLNQQGDRSFQFYQTDTANLYLDQSSISKMTFDKDILHFCSVSLQNKQNQDAHLKAIYAVKDSQGIISFDPNLRFMLWKDHQELKRIALEYIHYSNIVKLSEEELYALTGNEEEESAVKVLWHKQLFALWVTKGQDGVTVYTSQNHKRINGLAVNAVDTTGAGDAFIGSVLYSIQKLDCNLTDISFDQWVEITEFSNRMAALTTTFHGAISSYNF